MVEGAGATGARPRVRPRSVDAEAQPSRGLLDGLFVALLVVHLAPVWSVPTFPTEDGPLRVQQALQAGRLGATPALRAWLEPAPERAAPAYGLFTALARIAPPRTAERLLLTGWLLLLPLAFRALVGRSRRGRAAALGVFPFLYAYPLHLGAWGFLYGLALGVAALAAWAPSRGRLGPARAVAVGALLAAAALAHPLAGAAALLLAAALSAWRWWFAARHARLPRRRARVARGYRRRALALGAAAVPALAVLAAILARHAGAPTAREGILTAAGRLVSLYALVSMDRYEAILALPIAFALAAAVAYRLLGRAELSGRLRGSPVDGWLAGALACAALTLALPDAAFGEVHLRDQLAPVPFLALLAWLGATAGRARDVRRVTALLAVLSLAGLALRVPRYLEVEAQRAELQAAARALPAGTAVLPVALAPWGAREDGGRSAWRVRAFQNALGHEAAERDLVNLGDALAHRAARAPLRYAPGRDPFDSVGRDFGLLKDPPCVDLAAPVGGRPVDTVLVWGPLRPPPPRPEAPPPAPCATPLAPQLEGSFERVFTSSPRGLAQVWRRR